MDLDLSKAWGHLGSVQVSAFDGTGLDDLNMEAPSPEAVAMPCPGSAH